MSIVYNHYVKHEPWPQGVGNFMMQFWDAHEGHPIGKAMWYIKSLMVFTVLSPVYYYTVRWLKHFVPIGVLMLWGLNIPIDYPWFNVWLLLGAYLSIMEFSLKDIVDKLDWRICLAMYLLLKVLLFVDILPFNPSIPMALCCFLGLFGLLMKWNISSELALTSSFIYFAHPYVTGVRNIYIKFVDTSSFLSCFLIWILTATTVFLACYMLFRFMKRFTPKFLSIMTGDRI